MCVCALFVLHIIIINVIAFGEHLIELLYVVEHRVHLGDHLGLGQLRLRGRLRGRDPLVQLEIDEGEAHNELGLWVEERPKPLPYRPSSPLVLTSSILCPLHCC